MPWSDHIIGAFKNIAPDTFQTEFHGPYNKLLHSLFPPETNFMVSIRCTPGTCELPEFEVPVMFMFEVMYRNHPVFFLNVKQPAMCTWGEPDEQMRIRMSDIDDESPFPALHGVCAMGTMLCFYSQRKGKHIHPPMIPPSDNSSTALLCKYDLLEAEGEQKFRDVVRRIKKECEGH